MSRDIKFFNEVSQIPSEKQKEEEIIEEKDNMNGEGLDILSFPINNEEKESDENIQRVDSENSEKRLPGRPRIIRTGKPGRPRKEYRSTSNRIEQTETNEVNDESDDAEDEVFEEANANYAEIELYQAIEGENKRDWLEAIRCEFKSLLKNDTWEIAEKPNDRTLVDSKIVLTNKMDSNGEIYRRKARLVARGFSQVRGYDYKQTFAPVARLESLRILIAIAVEYDYMIHQLDITSAFLNGKLEEEIYLEIPELLEYSLHDIIEKDENESKRKAAEMLKQIRGKNKACCKLNKALYGLKQASRQWNILLDSKLQGVGLTASVAEPCIYFINQNDTFILVLVYVDDILITGNDMCKINEIKEQLKIEFETRDMGEAKFCVGIEIVRRRNEITLIQRKYINDALKRYGMYDAKGVNTPGNVNEQLTLGETSYDVGVPYRELIGTLMYLSVTSRPDIMNRVVYLAQFASAYQHEHWIAAKRILRYLKETINLGLTFRKGSFNLTGYADADWGSDINDRKSYTGYVFILSNAAIAWKSRKQKTVALSTTEAEYVAISESAKEAIYIKSFLKEIGIDMKIIIFNDNQSARLLTQNTVFHDRTKHIDLKHHAVRDAVKNNKFEIRYLPTEKMVADVLTKSLNKQKHLFCCRGLGLEDRVD